LTDRLANVGVPRGKLNERLPQVNSPRVAMQAELRTAERERDAARELGAQGRQHDRAALQHEVAKAQNALQMVRHSPSWRVTAPLRVMKPTVRRIRARRRG
jgi:hypothetical protein